MNNSNDLLISICVTSYNRLHTLERCLNSINSKYFDKIEIVVSEDCSPGRLQISEMVERFRLDSPFKVIYNCNSENLGYDRNFKKLVNLSNGKYLLFVTDDDELIGSNIDDLIQVIPTLDDFSVAFTPYFDTSALKYERRHSKTFLLQRGMQSVIDYLYSSILLSGLIFKKSDIPQYNEESLKDLIYSQVYVFSSILKYNDGYYINIPLINYIGDGVNSFGKNDAFQKNELLANRENYLSNLEFHIKLIKVIKFFDLNHRENLINKFALEYSLRSFTGMFIAKKKGGNIGLDEYWRKMNSLDIQLSFISHMYYYFLKYFGYKISELLLYPFKCFLKLYRSKN